MAQPQKQPMLAAYLLTVVVVMVMLVAAMVVTTRHAGVVPALMHLGAIVPTAASAAGASS